MMPSGAGTTNFGILKTRYESSQSTRRPRKSAAGSAMRWTAPLRRIDAGRTAAVDQAADLLAVGLEAPVEFHLDPARPRQRDVERAGDAPGPGRQDDDAVGEQDGLGDAMGDEEDRLRPLLPQAEQLQAHLLARHGIERP